MTESELLRLLAKHPEVEAGLHAEIDGLDISLQTLPQLKYTGQVVDEAMRLFPPAYALARVADATHEVETETVTVRERMLAVMERLARDEPCFTITPTASRATIRWPLRFPKESNLP